MSGGYGKPRQYWAAYVLGLLTVVMTALRIGENFSGSEDKLPAILALGAYTLFLSLEFVFSSRRHWSWLVYFTLQSGCFVFMASLKPFMDVTTSLLLPLFAQAYYYLTRWRASLWALVFVVLIIVTLVRGLGPLDGIAQSMLIVAEGIILTTFTQMVVQSHTDREESQMLVADLQAAHSKLEEYAAQAGWLAAEREQHRLRRELHDSVGQMIFSIELECESARLMLERDPTRVPAMLDHLQEMTGAALGQLRSIIAELQPRT